MAVLTIQRGDKLVTSTGENFFIRDLERYSYVHGSTPSFKRMATETVDVYRPPAIVSGRRGKPVKVLEGVKCTPIDSTRGEIESAGIGTGQPAETLITWIDGGQVFYRALLDQTENRS